MRQKDIQTGTTYLAKVGTRIAAVRVSCPAYYGRGRSGRRQWFAVNLATGRQVTVTAARLRAVYNPADPQHVRAVGQIPSLTIVGR